MKRQLALALAVSLASSVAPAAAQWPGFTDVSAGRDVERYSFQGAAGSNENYYDGDFGDYDGDGRIDRAILSRYGLLWNSGGGVMVPVSTQRDASRRPNSSESLTGLLFGDEVSIGNDAIQWIDLDGDGDLDVVMGGNGEPFVVQMNRGGRFAVTQRLSASAVQIVTTDLERDGDADLIVACWFPSGPDDFTIFVNDGAGNLSDETDARGMALAGSQVLGVASGDLDRDGDYDLAIISRTARQLWIYDNDGTGRFSRTAIDIIGSFGPTSGFAQGTQLGDVDGDGDLDLVMATNGYVGTSDVVGHIIWINDGAGGFVEESSSRFVVEGGVIGRLIGANAKLMDVDYDGDLDLFAFTDLAGPPLNFQLYLNDGAGVFTYTPEGVPSFGGARPDSTGADVDVADLDGDGTYDVWVGIGGGAVTQLRNGYADPSGRPADQPRDPRVVSAEPAGVRVRWRAPAFATAARHYRVLRSLSPAREPRDRELRATVGERFQDEGFAAPLGPATTAAELADPDVTIDGDELEWIDRDVTPGLTYHYSIVHVGTENAASAPSDEVAATVPASGGADVAPPTIQIVSPTTQSWGAHPRFVVTYADGGSGVDPASVRLTLDAAAGAFAAGANLAEQALVRDETTLIVALGPDAALALGGVVMTVEVSDGEGNVAMAQRTFGVTVSPGGSPTISASATPTAGAAPLPVTFEGTGTDADGEIARWEWYFGDGATGIGRRTEHTYRAAGTYDITVRALDHSGAAAVTNLQVSVDPCPEPCVPPDAGPSVDGGGVTSDGGGSGADSGTGPDLDAGVDRVPARGGCSATLMDRPGRGSAGLALFGVALVLWSRRRSKERG